MVDASVGGKNGVDLGSLKKSDWNVINVLQWLLLILLIWKRFPQNEMRSGLAEMLKHGLV